MGFTTGFLGGVTLTSSVLYLTLALHQKNRAQQAALLRQQRMVLSSLIEETPQIPETSPRHVVDGGLFEMAKDRWNRELESAVRRAYETDWRKVREQAEDSVTKVVERIREGK